MLVVVSSATVLRTAGKQSVEHLVSECAYEHWHRMLFARFLAENNLLMLIEDGENPVAVSLDEVNELAKDAKTNLWTLGPGVMRRRCCRRFSAPTTQCCKCR